MRRMPEGLRLVGGETISLIDRICGYDAARLPARAFPPAEEYVAALGHMLRVYRDPEAWIRDFAFELDLREIFLAGSDEDLDTISEILSERRPESGPLPERLTFLYRDLEFDTDMPAYDQHGLRHLSGEEIADMVAADAAGRRLMAHHSALLDAAFGTFFNGWTGLALRVVPAYEFRPLGLGYDHGLAQEAGRRSVVEVPRHGTRRLRTTGDQGMLGAARLDDRELHEWLTAHIEHGASAIPDADFGGRHPWVLVSADGNVAVAIDRDPAGWRLGVPQPIGVSERERLLTHTTETDLGNDR